jgi:phage tail tape-measure protein
METTLHRQQSERNCDLLTDEPGSHPLGTGVGAATGGAIAGAAVGTVAGPFGTVIGAAIGAIAGGLAGKAVAEHMHPTTDAAMPPQSEAVAAVDHETVARYAYGIWESQGRSEGHALDDWLAAESFVQVHL